MSIKLMSQVWELDISGTDQQVLLILCDHANDHGGSCYPSIDYVAWKMGVHRSTVMRALARLEKARVITVRREHKRVNRYQIHLDALPPKKRFSGRKMQPKLSSTSATGTIRSNHQRKLPDGSRGLQASGNPLFACNEFPMGTDNALPTSEDGRMEGGGVGRTGEGAWPSGPALERADFPEGYDATDDTDEER